MVEMVQPVEGDLDLALNTTTLTATGPLLAYTSVGRNGDQDAMRFGDSEHFRKVYKRKEECVGAFRWKKSGWKK